MRNPLRTRPWRQAVAVLLALAGCAAPPPPPPPTVVELTLRAAPDANAGPDGVGAPVVVRLYQLGSATGFDDADFFQIFNRDAATLRADLIKREDFTLAPGQVRTATIRPTEPVRAIGVFAGFREFQRTAWRASAPVPANATTLVAVTIAGGTVRLEASPAPPPAKPGS